jgi:hypothetical protein
VRLALLLVGCWSIGAARVCIAQEATLPSKSSFIIKLADEAIVADGSEAMRNREISRTTFAGAFLGGYANPDSTIPVNAERYFSRMNGKGWDAGKAYRRAHPDSVAQIMHEYGYKEFEGTGAWTYGFEAGGFQPDGVAEASASSQYWCWDLGFVRNADLDEQLGRIVRRDRDLAQNVTVRVHVKGYVSAPGSFGHMDLCQRQLYAVSITADGA